MDKYSPGLHAQRGWGLTETLLTLGALSVMAAAIYAVLQPTDAAAQIKVEQDNLRHLSQAVDRSMGLVGTFSQVSTDRVMADRLAPDRMTRDSALRSSWGTAVEVVPFSVNAPNDSFSVTYPGTPADVCSGLAAAMARDAYDIRVNGTSVYDARGLSPALASQRCAADNASMEFIFHSGLTTGTAVAAPPVVLPPAPPTITPPPGAPPIITIPGTPDVDPVDPGTPAVPPPAAPPVTPPAVPPPGSPPPITPPPPSSPPPPPPVTPPGTVCSAPAPTSGTETRTLNCPAGQFGQLNQERTATTTWSCPEAWGNPVESSSTGAWATVSSTCAACPTIPDQVETRWTPASQPCPAGEDGEHTWEAEERRTRSGSHNCPAGTTVLPPVSWSPFTPWAATGAKRNEVNTCAPVGCPGGMIPTWRTDCNANENFCQNSSGHGPTYAGLISAARAALPPPAPWPAPADNGTRRAYSTGQIFAPPLGGAGEPQCTFANVGMRQATLNRSIYSNGSQSFSHQYAQCECPAVPPPPPPPPPVMTGQTRSCRFFYGAAPDPSGRRLIVSFSMGDVLRNPPPSAPIYDFSNPGQWTVAWTKTYTTGSASPGQANDSIGGPNGNIYTQDEVFNPTGVRTWTIRGVATHTGTGQSYSHTWSCEAEYRHM